MLGGRLVDDRRPRWRSVPLGSAVNCCDANKEKPAEDVFCLTETSRRTPLSRYYMLKVASPIPFACDQNTAAEITTITNAKAPTSHLHLRRSTTTATRLTTGHPYNRTTSHSPSRRANAEPRRTRAPPSAASPIHGASLARGGTPSLTGIASATPVDTGRILTHSRRLRGLSGRSAHAWPAPVPRSVPRWQSTPADAVRTQTKKDSVARDVSQALPDNQTRCRPQRAKVSAEIRVRPEYRGRNHDDHERQSTHEPSPSASLHDNSHKTYDSEPVQQDDQPLSRRTGESGAEKKESSAECGESYPWGIPRPRGNAVAHRDRF